MKDADAKDTEATDTEAATDDSVITNNKKPKNSDDFAAVPVGNPLNSSYSIVGDDDDDDGNGGNEGNAGGSRYDDDGERIWQKVAKENEVASSSGRGAEPSTPGDDSDATDANADGNGDEVLVIDETTTGLERLMVLLSQVPRISSH